jgi:RNA polymerase sigma factor (sigma-70 family)
MKLNEAYNNWKLAPSQENYEIFGKQLLKYVTSLVQKNVNIKSYLREEIIGDSLIRVLEKESLYNPEKGATFATFVRMIIDNVLSEQLQEFKDQAENQLFEGNLGHNPYKGIEAKILLKQLMETLSVGERRLAELQLEGLEDEEIASELGIPVGTVWSRWNRIKEKMRKASE